MLLSAARRVISQVPRLITGPVRRHMCSAGEAGTKSKSMLDVPGMGPGTSVLGQAAEAQLQKMKMEMEAAGQQPPTHAASFLRRMFSRIGDLFVLSLLGAGGASAYYYYAYDLKDLVQVVEETKRDKDNGVARAWCTCMDYYIDLRKKAEAIVRTYSDPTYDKLLPDMAPELKGRIKTLVLDLDDLLIHREWTRQKGWTITKRPGVQDFIFEIGQYFEIVVFTDEPATFADPIITKLDTHRVIPFRLYRPETQYHNGKHVRDLSKLNRDLSQVLMVSAKPEAWEFQPENTIKLKPWENDPKDTMLLDLIPFLQMIAVKGVRDVREVVKSYDGEDNIPRAFKARMHHIQETSKPGQRGFFSLG